MCTSTGSFTTGLSIPASDVDVVVTNIPEGLPWRNGGGQHLTVLADTLSTQDWVSSAQTIKHAAVPIVKLTTAPVPTRFGDSRGVIRIDVSFDWPAGTHRGVQSSTLVQRLCAMNRNLTPLVLVLKQLLLQRGLSDTYTGGLSSYALTIMVASILQRHNLEAPELQPDLGTLLLTFLQVFGTGFDTRRYGVSLSTSGPLFTLSSWSPHVPRVGTPEYWQPADPVVIQDPLLPSHNVGRSCFGFRQVQLVFDECLDGICRYVDAWQAQQNGGLGLAAVPEKLPLEAMKDKTDGEAKKAVGPAHSLLDGDCSILGQGMFGAHHHNQVMNLICQIWCPFEISPHSPQGSEGGDSHMEEEGSDQHHHNHFHPHRRSRSRSSSGGGGESHGTLGQPRSMPSPSVRKSSKDWCESQSRFLNGGEHDVVIVNDDSPTGGKGRMNGGDGGIGDLEHFHPVADECESQSNGGDNHPFHKKQGPALPGDSLSASSAVLAL